MTKLAPEWVRTSDPVIRSPVCYRWIMAPAHTLMWNTSHSYYIMNEYVIFDSLSTLISTSLYKHGAGDSL